MNVSTKFLTIAATIFAAVPLSAAIVTPTAASSTTGLSGRGIGQTINASSMFDGTTSTTSGTNDKGNVSKTLLTSITSANVGTAEAGAATTYFADGYWLTGSITFNTDVDGNNVNTTEVLTFDFDQAYDLTGFYAWNYNRDGANNDRAMKTFDIQFSTDFGQSYGTLNSASSLGIADLTQHPATAGSSAETYVPVDTRTFTATQSGVTNVRFSNLQNYGSSDRIGLAEIRFEGAAVPEPSALGLIGLVAALGLIRRRR